MELLRHLDPLVEMHEQKFGNNLTKNELTQLNTLLEKFRN